MQLGLGSFAFTWAIGVPGCEPVRPMGALDFLAEAKRLRVRVVQICDNLPLTRLSQSELAELEEAARDADITIELGARGLGEENIRAHLALASRLQSPLLRLVVDEPGDQPSPAEVQKRLRAVLPAFAESGVRLALENHDRFTSRTLAAIVEELASRQIGICLDTVNSFGALEGPEAVVENLARHAFSLHVKDFIIRRPEHHMGFVIEGCAAGRGRLDIPWLLERLSALAPQPLNAILETWVTPGRDLAETITRERAWTESGIAYLSRLLADGKGRY